MSHYTIAINEAQRAIILAALEAATAHDQSPAEFNDTPEDEAKVLREMFNSLPIEEAKSIHVNGHRPGETIHGFAL